MKNLLFRTPDFIEIFDNLIKRYSVINFLKTVFNLQRKNILPKIRKILKYVDIYARVPKK